MFTDEEVNKNGIAVLILFNSDQQLRYKPPQITISLTKAWAYTPKSS